MKEVRIFLASSNELKEERELFERNIYRKCQEWFASKQTFLYLDIWENMSAAMTQTHSQDKYNEFVQNADIVVVLAYSKIGEYTFSEFKTAQRTFKSTNKPFLFVYFKANPPYTGNNLKDLQSLEDFKKLLAESGYFYPSFTDFNDLWNQFNKELDRLVDNEFRKVTQENQQNELTGTNTDNSTNQTHSGTGNNIGGDYVGGDKISGNKIVKE
ncbi:hypothetical protein [Flammeovirga sp. SJP92]|uniref:hypothetical protein n=1 Tax=Flammeovirga sp. SJP92 TaxID=1775430 RepID=UPI0007876821|nr:hypothetical protein [Flammeovirga sp. SJP92]KXX70866.1 hypothetical protein AVL50_10865 [Flammeovirga sp. SJP92]